MHENEEFKLVETMQSTDSPQYITNLAKSMGMTKKSLLNDIFWGRRPLGHNEKIHGALNGVHE